ncbi:MAG: endonuclease/exonuclease/phosphatase family protein [Treponema sp.]|jgi:endonuclease/exonuclease/phosphatase family metal-dependent hydrolase|nr:endonuclease/exonuclease/phosphatase family protein [Treponema sp.]
MKKTGIGEKNLRSLPPGVHGMFSARKAWILCLLAAFFGCEAPFGDKTETVTILSWNVQTLFDGNETGNEYDEYREGAGWTNEKYSGRLNALSRAIGGIEEKPDVIALVEVETSETLAALVRNPLEGRGYNQIRFANNHEGSLGVGIISRLPVLKASTHSLYSNGETTPRPVLEAWIDPGNSPVVLFVCHWKSKIGGDDETEAFRMASVRLIQRRIREIRKDNPAIPMIITGDLNENHDGFYRRGAKTAIALMPDDPLAAATADRDGGQNDFLVISGNKPPLAVHFPGATEVFFSPWETELENGSYYYKNTWETIDHFLLSKEFFDTAGWEYESCRVVNEEPFTGRHGYPSPYNPRNGAGLSDHLPLLLRLRMVPSENNRVVQ